MEVCPEIQEAIKEAIIAGACWRAAEISLITADTWEGLAAEHSSRAATLLGQAVERLGV